MSGDTVTVGFDGSRQRHQGITDATAIVACRVSDGHVFVPLDGSTIWEAPPGPAGQGWAVPVAEVDAAMRAVFARYNVVGCYCDPNRWESFVAAWEGAYGHRAQVKASPGHPFTWWPIGKRATAAVESFHAAVVAGELTHDGNPRLAAHVLNARRRVTPYGVSISKEFPSSPRKVDAAMAAVQAWQARLDAVSKGVHTVETFVPRRIR